MLTPPKPEPSDKELLDYLDKYGLADAAALFSTGKHGDARQSIRDAMWRQEP